MLGRGALALHADGFGARRGQLGAGPRQVEFANIAQVEAALRDLDAFFTQAHRVGQRHQLGIERAQPEIGLRDVGLQGQQHRAEVGFGSRRIASRRRHTGRHSAEQVDLVAGRQARAVARVRVGPHALRQVRFAWRQARTLGADAHADLRDTIRFGDAGNRARLLDAAGRDRQVGIVGGSFLNQRGERRIVEGQPPLAARLLLGRLRRLPARAVNPRHFRGRHWRLRLAEGVRRGHVRLHEVGRGAGRQQQRRQQGRDALCNHRIHQCTPSALCATAGAVCTGFSKRLASERSNT